MAKQFFKIGGGIVCSKEYVDSKHPPKKKIEVSYIVHYFNIRTQEELYTDYGTSFTNEPTTVYAMEIGGYQLISEPTQTRFLSENPEENVFWFYYI